MGSRRTKQLSITIDTDVLTEVEKRVKAEKKSLSAFVSEALAETVRRHYLRVALDDFERKSGPITSEERKWARKALDDAKAKMNSRKRRRRAA